nr:TolC family protein [Bacteriovorax sp. HI3]
MKMSPRFFFFLSSVLVSWSSFADSTTLVENFRSLQEKSKDISPELKTVRAFRSQKKAENYTRFTSHLPNVNLVLKREKDFFEDKNAALRALGIGVLNSSWAIQYEWSLVNLNQIQNTRKSFAEKDKSDIDVEIKESEYPIQFTTYFLNYLLAKYKTAAVENSLKKAETGKKEAQLGFDLGQKTKIDVLRSDANLVSLTSKKTSYIEEEQNAKNRFVEYSGLEQKDLDFVSNLSEEQILELINSLSSVAAKKEVPNLSASPKYQSLQMEEKINRMALSDFTRNEYPDLRIQGSYTNAADSWDGTLHNPTRSHTVALVLTIPLFNGGSFASSHFEKYFAKKQIEYSIGLKKQQLENDLNTTLIRINALETLVSSLTLNVSQFEELYRLTSKSYQLGKSSLFELLEVQDDLLDSKINLAQNKIQFYTLSQNYLWQAGL